MPLTVKDFKGKAEPDWCPGCGDFGVLRRIEAGARGAGDSSAPGDGDQRHWLLFEPARLHEHLRHAYFARPRAVSRHRRADGQSRTENHRHRRRRRWLRHRRQPFRALDAAQRRSHLYRDEQPGLWSNNRPDLADQHQGNENQEHAGGQRGESAQSDSAGDRRRRDLRRQRLTLGR